MTRPEYNRAWPRVRLTILERDNYRCTIEGPTCKGKAEDVDHIIPVAEGGAWLDPANLRSVCRSCHNARKRRKLVVVRPEESTPSRQWLEVVALLVGVGVGVMIGVVL